MQPTTSSKGLRSALGVLAETLTRFNQRWLKFLQQVDLSVANTVRDKYNRYYLVEKECVVGSTRLARRGYQPLPPLTIHEVEAAFPLLPELELTG